MKLDKFWEYQKGRSCPFCNKVGLWYDTHEDKDATHYCKKCGEGMLIIGACENERWGKMKSQSLIAIPEITMPELRIVRKVELKTKQEEEIKNA